MVCGHPFAKGTAYCVSLDRFSKSMYEAKQNLTVKRAGGPGEGVQGDRERQAFTPADQKRIDAWILTKVNCLLINSGRLLVLKNTWI